MSEPEQVSEEPTSPPFELEAVEEPTSAAQAVDGELEPEPTTAQTDASTASSLTPNVKELKSQFESISLSRSASDEAVQPAEESSTPPAAVEPSEHFTPATDRAQSSLESIAISADQTPTASATTQASSTEGQPTAEGDEGANEAAPPVDAPAPKPSPQPKLPTSAPTTMQKVVSLTRQRDLPPKSKEEEKKHLRELEAMLTASKEAEQKRRASAQAEQIKRSAALAAALPTWEREILPNWHAVLKEDSAGRSLRHLWWEGTMPSRHRGRLWSLCIGNALAIGKGAYVAALARGQAATSNGRLSDADKRRMEEDVAETLPTLKLFHPGGVMHDDLIDLLVAFSAGGATEAHYPPGLSFLAAMLLLNMPPPEAFIALANLVHKSCLKSFYAPDKEDEKAYYRVFDTLLADFLPRVYSNFSSQVVRPSLYLSPWLTTVFVKFLPIDLATRLLDVFLLEGDSFLFRVALVLLQILEPRLFTPSLEDLDAVFKGEDKGAVAIVKREKSDGVKEGPRVERDEVYDEMGCDEDALFGGLQSLDWKEETWGRLVERELPDADI